VPGLCADAASATLLTHSGVRCPAERIDLKPAFDFARGPDVLQRFNSARGCENLRYPPSEALELGRVFVVRIISGRLRELVGPCVDDGMTIDVLDAGRDALLELLF
jgi:hypothetical protein